MDLADYILPRIPRIGEFLDEMTRLIDNKLSARLSEELLDQLRKNFEHSMINASGLFGKHAFRKWPEEDERVNRINRALFEVWSVILADYEWNVVKSHKAAIVEKARDMMLHDEEFISSVSTATGSSISIITRYSKVRSILAEAGL